MKQSFSINDFEGPLDLLLHLIKENKMDIFDIEITDLINQYLSFIDNAKSINLEITSDFLIMSTTLLEIKSKLLLPKTEVEIDDEYQEDNQDELIKRLIEYKQYKELSEQLKIYNEERKHFFTKPLEDLSSYRKDEKMDISFDEVNLYDLSKSMDKIFERIKFRQPILTKLENKEISIEARSKSLLKQINKYQGQRIALEDLIDVPTKEYMIITFLAILDLARQNTIIIKQRNNFNDIYIEEVI